ncbi:MAG: cyclic pyranopterin monophosphate synthase MoaC [Bdellovibrionales bacterium]|nr:cyclic pyranopterin monophosphate synthase MoaC [Bdellovibrionales bacterium]
MVDVSHKDITLRQAIAETVVQLPEVIFQVIEDGEIHSPKGPVFQTAVIAGTMAAKRTHELIPFCHPLAIESCKVDIQSNQSGLVTIRCQVKIHHKTGVEMEALTGATIAALTIYDMCKALSHDIVIEKTVLVEKKGGKSDVSRL